MHVNSRRTLRTTLALAAAVSLFSFAPGVSAQEEGAAKPAGEAAAPAPAEAPAAATDMPKDTRAYALGVVIAEQVGQTLEDVGVDKAAFLESFTARINGVESKMTQEQIRTELQAMEEDANKQQEAKMTAAANTNKEMGQKFLEDNKKKEGVKTTESGLQYKVLAEGKGDSPTGNDEVTAHYKGMLLSGDVFDSSYDRGEPMSTKVGGVIPGWQEALKLMKPGSKYEIWIPSDLAYGEQGIGPIGPNEVLHFEMELIDVKKGE